MAYQVIIPAAGQGKRMGAGKNKLLLKLNDLPVLIHTIKIFAEDKECSGIIIAIHPQDMAEFTSLLEENKLTKNLMMVPGGAERQHSVFNALQTIRTESIVLVHDAARPFIDKAIIDELAKVAETDGAAVAAVPVKDTIKKIKHNQVIETVERSSLWAVQTPQAFRVSVLRAAHLKAIEDGFVGTDDASLVERLMHPVMIVEGNYDNIKLTTPEDLYFAEAIIRKRQIQR